jgi:microcystin-dependent protein
LPRNGSGTYSVPTTYTSGQTITAAVVNSNFSDVGTELTNSVARDGQTSMTGALKASNGTAAAPAVTFASDTDTGIYRKSANTIGVACGGSEVAAISSSGIELSAGFVTVMPPGAMMPYVGTTAPTGWVRANGRTIGNASSSATERANADTEDLFTVLWDSYSDSVCAVSSGRGASAAVDYAANKTIALPDLRGRSFFGLDDMGNSAASRLGSVITSATTNGASGGTETVALSADNLAAHTHGPGTLATGAGSAHSHVMFGTAASAGDITTADQLVALNHEPGSVNGYRMQQTSNTPSRGKTGDESSHTHSVTSGATASTGSGTAHSNMPPAWLTTFIIKL